MSVEEYILPEYWASYIVNGDASSLSDNEKAKADQFLREKNLVGCSATCSDTSRFSRFHDAKGPACNVLDYSFLKS